MVVVGCSSWLLNWNDLYHMDPKEWETIQPRSAIRLLPDFERQIGLMAVI